MLLAAATQARSLVWVCGCTSTAPNSGVQQAPAACLVHFGEGIANHVMSTPCQGYEHHGGCRCAAGTGSWTTRTAPGG